jgi:hypothetical protein
MVRVTVLYEDARNPKAKGYGPHALIKQYLADRIAVDPWTINDEELLGIAEKGNSNVRKACRMHLAKLAASGGMVVAVYDADQAPELAQLPSSACKSQLIKGLKDGCVPEEKLVVVLLYRNLETVLTTLRTCAPSLATDATWDKAIHGKKLVERDQILVAASKPTEAGRAIRAKLCEQVPSLAYLISKIERAWRGSIRSSDKE